MIRHWTNGGCRGIWRLLELLSKCLMSKHDPCSSLELLSSAFDVGRWTFKVGGKGKTGKQIRGVKEAFIVADGIEYGSGKQLPLWLFGFQY